VADVFFFVEKNILDSKKQGKLLSALLFASSRDNSASAKK